MNTLKRKKGDSKFELIRRAGLYAKGIVTNLKRDEYVCQADLATAWERGYRSALADIRKEMKVFRTEPPALAICNPTPMTEEEIEYHIRCGTITE